MHKDQAQHKATDCKMREDPCAFCQKPVRRLEMAQHQCTDCPLSPVARHTCKICNVSFDGGDQYKAHYSDPSLADRHGRPHLLEAKSASAPPSKLDKYDKMRRDLPKHYQVGSQKNTSKLMPVDPEQAWKWIGQKVHRSGWDVAGVVVSLSRAFMMGPDDPGVLCADVVWEDGDRLSHPLVPKTQLFLADGPPPVIFNYKILSKNRKCCSDCDGSCSGSAWSRFDFGFATSKKKQCHRPAGL